MNFTEIKKAALAACADVVKGAGFTSARSTNSFTRRAGDDVEWWIGLNLLQAGSAGQLGVNPTVGIRFKHVEQVLAELANDWPKGAPPLIGRPLGYLMPEKRFKTWLFEPGTDLQVVADDLGRAVESFAIPFCEEFGDPAVLEDVSKIEGFIPENRRATAVPIILAQGMKRDEAAEAVARELQSLEGKQDAYAESYRYFADGFARAFDVSFG